uniref:Probable U3 small nucleolar RNA-associated protein 11 n=1 Tax=Octopus bimaculoides TaxID=37653 RepID=A0A0L8I917_OCTBM
MSSFKNARKSGQKMHKERSQPSAREKLGFLEKKKDYKRRATEDQRRKGVIKSLKVKALNRNPDEFYFNMVRNKKVDGIHQPRESAEKVHTEDQVKLMLSRDLKYIRMKRMTESNKIKRLTAELHLLDTADEIKNNHTIFVDTEADVKKFDAAEHFHTHPLLVNRRHNRIKTDQLQQMDIGATLDEQTVEHGKWMLNDDDKPATGLAPMQQWSSVGADNDSADDDDDDDDDGAVSYVGGRNESLMTTSSKGEI